MTEDVRSLEQRVARLETALSRATAELERMRVGQRRPAGASRILAGILGTSLGLVLLGAARGGPAAMQGPQPLTVRVPFTVVDEQGGAVMTVVAESDRGLQISTADQALAFLGIDEENSLGLQLYNEGEKVATLGNNAAGDPGLFVYNAAGHDVAGVGTSNDGGGWIGAMSNDASEQVQLKVRKDIAGLWYYRAGQPLMTLGRGEQGNVALRVRSGKNTVAGIGESADGSGGAMLLQDAGGVERVRAAIAQGQGGQVVVSGPGGGEAGVATKGSVGSVYAGPKESPLAKMGESETTPGAGHLILAAPGGGAAVQAGYKGNIGLVVAYGEGKPAAILSPGVKIPGFTAGANW